MVIYLDKQPMFLVKITPLQGIFKVMASVCAYVFAGQSIHARTMITSMLPMCANGQSVHVRTMAMSVLPMRANGQSMHVRTMQRPRYQCVPMARASMCAMIVRATSLT